MNALAVLFAAHDRGIRLSLGADGKALAIDKAGGVTQAERRHLAALKSTLVGLLRTDLPSIIPDSACDAFDSAVGVALCSACGYNLPAHRYKRPTCTFFVGHPSRDTSCRRCGEPFLEHVGIAKAQP